MTLDIFKGRGTGFDDGLDVAHDRKRRDKNISQLWELTSWRAGGAIL